MGKLCFWREVARGLLWLEWAYHGQCGWSGFSRVLEPGRPQARYAPSCGWSGFSRVLEPPVPAASACSVAVGLAFPEC